MAVLHSLLQGSAGLLQLDESQHFIVILFDVLNEAALNWKFYNSETMNYKWNMCFLLFDEASDFLWAGDLFITLLRKILHERWRARAIAHHKRQALYLVLDAYTVQWQFWKWILIEKQLNVWFLRLTANMPINIQNNALWVIFHFFENFLCTVSSVNNMLEQLSLFGKFESILSLP